MNAVHRSEFDPIILEVLRNRVTVIADEMQAALIRSAFSIIVKEGGDCGVAVFDAAGNLISSANALPANLGILTTSVNRIIEDYPAATMRDGDAYIFNDPYEGGTHLPDVAIIVPIVHEGKTVAISAAISHQQDFGGMVQGSMPPDSTEIFQEGLILPPCKIVSQGELNTDLMRLILKNVRMPNHTRGDLRALMAACDVGRRRFLETIEEYGLETVESYLAELANRAEQQAREKIEAIPDGVYRFVDYLDNDGIDLETRHKIEVAVTVSGSEMHFDFTGTGPQMRGSANSAYSGPIACAYYVAHCVYGSDVPNNAGCYRPLSLNVPKGTLLNPEHPAALCSRTMTLYRTLDSIFGALMQAIPTQLRAASGGSEGVSISGRRGSDNSAYVYVELFAAGMGARPTKDGVEYIETDTTNMLNTPIEALELEYPVRIHQLLLREDGGGAGRFRGGVGLIKEFEILDGQTEITHRGDRFFTQPWGLLGGRPGQSWSTTINRRNGETFSVPARMRFKLNAGDRMLCLTAGGGGYGDPLDRDVLAVVNDVKDRKVSRQSALDDYGVVIDETTGGHDEQATAKRREELAQARGPVTWTFDRGGDLGLQA